MKKSPLNIFVFLLSMLFVSSLTVQCKRSGGTKSAKKKHSDGEKCNEQVPEEERPEECKETPNPFKGGAEKSGERKEGEGENSETVDIAVLAASCPDNTAFDIYTLTCQKISD